MVCSLDFGSMFCPLVLPSPIISSRWMLLRDPAEKDVSQTEGTWRMPLPSHCSTTCIFFICNIYMVNVINGSPLSLCELYFKNSFWGDPTQIWMHFPKETVFKQYHNRSYKHMTHNGWKREQAFQSAGSLVGWSTALFSFPFSYSREVCTHSCK